MTENHNQKYNFKAHIINLSHSDNFDDALKEWIQMPGIYKKLHEGLCKCICQRVIKYFHYIYNKITKKYINVGTECFKKFNFIISNNKINKFLKEVLDKFAKGEYENIDDLEEYSTNIQLRIEQDLKDRYEKNSNDLDILYMLKDNIEELIKDYNFTDLEDLKNLVIQTITVLEQKKFKEEQIKQQIEEERIKKIKIEEEELKLIHEEERKLDEELAREKQEIENEKQLVKINFEEGYYINIKKNDKDTYKETILLNFIQSKEAKITYIQTFINKYESNIYLYQKLKHILDKKINHRDNKIKETEDKKKQEQQLLKEKKKQELQKELEEIKNINLKKIAETEVIQKDYILFENIFINKRNEMRDILRERRQLLERLNHIDNTISYINKLELDTNSKKSILDKQLQYTDIISKEQSRINNIQIIHNKIILYTNNIEKWKLMTDKKEINETDGDCNKRIIYTKNGPLKIKDIILLSEIKIDKDIEQKIRQIEYIEDTNDDYIEMGKSWLVNYINYKEFINFDINTICDINLKFYVLNTKTLQYLRDNETELEFYIRYKLGQRIFPDNDNHYQKHLKFNFDEDIEFDSQDNEYSHKSSNKYIIELFNNFYIDKTILIHTHKGLCYVRFININNQIIDTIEYTGKGTVNILMEILKYDIKQVKFPEFIPNLDNVLILQINYIDYYLCEKTNNVFEINKDEDIGKFIGVFDKQLKKITYI